MPTKLRLILLSTFFIGCSGLNAGDEEKIDIAICESAREHMPPDLAKCQNFECVEDLLRAKEENLALLTLVKSGISVEKSVELMKKYRSIRAAHKRAVENSPIQSYETRRLDKSTFDTTRHLLEKSGMNPQKVNITSRRISSKDTSLGLATPAMCAEKAETKPAIIDYPPKDREVPSMRTMAHEVTHLDEAHSWKQVFISQIARTRKINIFTEKKVDAHYTFSLLGRMHEMQADLLPLIRFKDPQIARELLKKRQPQCEFWYMEGSLKDKWNLPVGPVPTHAGCTEELPYILKIQDLRSKGAKPLYEKD